MQKKRTKHMKKSEFQLFWIFSWFSMIPECPRDVLKHETWEIRSRGIRCSAYLANTRYIHHIHLRGYGGGLVNISAIIESAPEWSLFTSFNGRGA